MLLPKQTSLDCFRKGLWRVQISIIVWHPNIINHIKHYQTHINARNQPKELRSSYAPACLFRGGPRPLGPEWLVTCDSDMWRPLRWLSLCGIGGSVKIQTWNPNCSEAEKNLAAKVASGQHDLLGRKKRAHNMKISIERERSTSIRCNALSLSPYLSIYPILSYLSVYTYMHTYIHTWKIHSSFPLLNAVLNTRSCVVSLAVVSGHCCLEPLEPNVVKRLDVGVQVCWSTVHILGY